MKTWGTETMLLVAGDTKEEAAAEAQRIIAEYPDFPWLSRGGGTIARALPDNEELTILNPDAPVTLRAVEWAAQRGPGLLCVMDFTTGQPGPLRGPEWLRQLRETKLARN